VGALVFYAKTIPWEFPGFSVERCLTPLLKLQEGLEEGTPLTTREHRFLIVARKPRRAGRAP
jgi:hypothetical protein